MIVLETCLKITNTLLYLKYLEKKNIITSCASYLEKPFERENKRGRESSQDYPQFEMKSESGKQKINKKNFYSENN